MKFVGSRFRNNVDHSSASPSKFGGIAVGVDLELLHCILRELVRSAAGTGAAQRLPEERVVIIGAVNGKRIQRPALAGKAEVAAAHVAIHSRSEQHKIHEVAPVETARDWSVRVRSMVPWFPPPCARDTVTAKNKKEIKMTICAASLLDIRQLS